MSYRQSPAYIAAAKRAAADRQRQRGTRGCLANVGRNPLTLKARLFNACEVR